MENGRVTCTATKAGFVCIKFPTHPGRHRFQRTYAVKMSADPAKEVRDAI